MAYIYLVVPGEPVPGRSVRTVELSSMADGNADRSAVERLNIDFDAEGRIIGIEVEGAASSVLHDSLIAIAERI